jgi:hypothetical protein
LEYRIGGGFALLDGNRRTARVHHDIERRLAIAELLAQPDPPELQRGHRLRFDGKPDRHEWVPVLSAVFVQNKLLALQERRAATDESIVHRSRSIPQALRMKNVLAAA